LLTVIAPVAGSAAGAGVTDWQAGAASWNAYVRAAAARNECHELGCFSAVFQSDNNRLSNVAFVCAADKP
jgi:hypothetical protein